jgi:hypothetical protein
MRGDVSGWLVTAFNARAVGRHGRLQQVSPIESIGYLDHERLLVWDGTSANGQRVTIVAYTMYEYWRADNQSKHDVTCRITQCGLLGTLIYGWWPRLASRPS